MRVHVPLHYYEQVTESRLEDYLLVHGWTQKRAEYTDDHRLIGRWWQHGATVLVVPTRLPADRIARIADAVITLAAVEKRQPTAILYALLDPPLDREFVLDCFPQLATALSTQG